jgi:hypothetical protein
MFINMAPLPGRESIRRRQAINIGTPGTHPRLATTDSEHVLAPSSFAAGLDRAAGVELGSSNTGWF